MTRTAAVAIAAVLVARRRGVWRRGRRQGREAAVRVVDDHHEGSRPVAPLTGLPDPDGAAQTRPVLSIKVENTPEARPQTGLESADVVWNEVVEGEITRLPRDVPVALDRRRRPDPLGAATPTRSSSGRSAGSSRSPAARRDRSTRSRPRRSSWSTRTRPATRCSATRSRRAPHNLFGHPDRLWALGGEPVPPPPLFQYLEAGKAPTGTPAASVSIGFKGRYSGRLHVGRARRARGCARPKGVRS